MDSDGWSEWYKAVSNGKSQSFWRDHGYPCHEQLISAQWDSSAAQVHKAPHKSAGPMQCGAEVLVERPPSRGGMMDIEGFRIVSADPLVMESVSGLRFPNDGLPKAGTTEWGSAELLPSDVPLWLEKQKDKLRNSEQTCRIPPDLCQVIIANQRKLAGWLECVAANTAGYQGASHQDELDIVTPSVPGCPRYLRKSLVAWSRKPGGNPQLNVWQVRNVSDRILKVTYRVDGANNDSGTLNPGDVAEVWRIEEPPPYVVRDYKELMVFNAKESQKKSLACDLAIRPR